MRLSTERSRDDARAVEVLHAAFDAGVNFLDTADAYCWDTTDAGHNERLIARAIDTWPGDRSRVRVATKGGLTRPDGNWVPDGRARHLTTACEASLKALGVDRIALYQLHAPDPRTPFATSIRALAALKRAGLIESIGLCNVTVGQIEEARRLAEIDAVQVELSVWRDRHILSGVAEYCIANNITLLAHRPLGGTQNRHRASTDATLVELAARHAATPFEIALAWLQDFSPLVVPLPGPTRVETAQSVARVRRIALDDGDRQRLDERFPAGRLLRMGQPPKEQRPRPESKHGEVVIIMGLPGAGKSTIARALVAQGYERLNRDEAGGTLSSLVPALDRLIASGSSRIVLDNTYASRASRRAVIDAAATRGLPVRCVSLSTTLEDAQVNAVWRMVQHYDRLLTPEEMRKEARKNPMAFGPAAQFRFQRELEAPELSEGFSQIDVTPFERQRDPSFVNKAIVVWCDGVLTHSRSGRRAPASVDDLEVIEETGTVLRQYQSEGWRLLGLSWQPEIADGTVVPGDVDAVFVRMRELLKVDIDIAYCLHGAGPPTCWCRKPLPGLGVVFIQRHGLDPAQCIYVGAGPQDPGFARRLGFQYQDAAVFFG